MLSIFDHNCLKKCKNFVLQLFKTRNEVKDLVDSYQPIPKKIIENYIKQYNSFSHHFFNSKTINCLKKNKLNLDNLLKDMEQTKKEIQKYKNKIEETNLLLKIVMKNLIDNYMEFLNISDNICDNFIKNYKKYIK